jgi:hypothetical protein
MSGVLKCRYFRRRRPRQSTAALGLTGDSRKQGIDFSIVQALQRSGQVFRQQITGLRGRIVQYGFALWDSRGLGRPWRWRSRKQVWCGLRRPPRWHDANYAAGISSRQQAGCVYATAFKSSHRTVPESDCLAHKVLPALHRHVEISRVDFDNLIP